MLIYYSFFDAIADIYGKFIQTKEREWKKQYRIARIGHVLFYYNSMYGLSSIKLEHTIHFSTTHLIRNRYTLSSVYRKPRSVNAIISTDWIDSIELYKVIVSIAFDLKINKTICRPLTTVNNSIGCMHSASYCGALHRMPFTFMIQSKWNLMETIQRDSENAFACTNFIREIPRNT